MSLVRIFFFHFCIQIFGKFKLRKKISKIIPILFGSHSEKKFAKIKLLK
jgi:hypothetical protein